MPISHGHNRFEYEDYVPELEADELISAVKLKQNMYDEGRTKIQDFYDQMSALPLVRDVDKQYMNDQLNQIFDVIEKNAGNADFSNPQTVRSFLKIADPLKKDPILKNALDASAEYNNRIQTLEDIKTKTPEKYSPANEWDYLNDLEEWMNGATPGQKLQRKSYLPYTDNSKHYGELIKGLEAQVETEFHNMSNIGLINKEEIKSLKQNRIKELLMQSMTPSMKAQMDIDARYHTSNLSNEEKYNKVVSIYQTISERNKTLSRVRGIENETGMTNEEYAMEAQAADEILASLVDPNTGEIKRTTLDALYSNAYISDWAEGLGKTYAYRQVKSSLTQNALQMQRVRDAAAMKRIEEKAILDHGYVRNPTTGKLEPGPNFVAPGTKKVEKPVAAPKIFNSNINDARLDDLRTGKVKEISYTGDQYENNMDNDWKLRVMAAAAANGYTELDAATGLPKEGKGVEKLTIVKDGNKIGYKIKFEGDDTERYIKEGTLATPLDKYFNNSTETEVVRETPVSTTSVEEQPTVESPNTLTAEQMAILQNLSND